MPKSAISKESTALGKEVFLKMSTDLIRPRAESVLNQIENSSGSFALKELKISRWFVLG